jgi:sec-independent protein translocase protein TatA
MGIGVTELLLVLAIVALLFGTKKLRSIGGDLGTAIQSFRKAMSDGDAPAEPGDQPPAALRKDDEPKP